MSNIIATLVLVSFLSLSKEQKIIATYSAISCTCAQWQVEGQKENIYLERANKELPDVNKIWDGKHLPFKVMVKGRFKRKKGIPDEFSKKGHPQMAKIFVYNQLEMIEQ